MSSPYEMFGMDENLEKDGITVNYGSFRFLIARAGGSNTKYLRMVTKKMRPYRKAIDTGTISEEVAEKVMREIFVDAVLLGWEGVTDREGNLLEYNRDNALQLFKDLPDLFIDLRDQATDLSNFRRETTEETIKN